LVELEVKAPIGSGATLWRILIFKPYMHVYSKGILKATGGLSQFSM